MKSLLLIAAALFVGYTLFVRAPEPTTDKVPSSITEKNTGSSDAVIAEAFSNRRSNIQVSGTGVVTKLLPDDNSGSRHQRFILRFSPEQTLLISHNIDLAPRIRSLKEGDSVRFYGEYGWSKKGGIIHWTHRDPNGSHMDGWLEHKGQRYQ